MLSACVQSPSLSTDEIILLGKVVDYQVHADEDETPELVARRVERPIERGLAGIALARSADSSASLDRGYIVTEHDPKSLCRDGQVFVPSRILVTESGNNVATDGRTKTGFGQDDPYKVLEARADGDFAFVARSEGGEEAFKSNLAASSKPIRLRVEHAERNDAREHFAQNRFSTGGDVKPGPDIMGQAFLGRCEALSQ